jgi:hypothetical protein
MEIYCVNLYDESFEKLDNVCILKKIMDFFGLTAYGSDGTEKNPSSLEK